MLFKCKFHCPTPEYDNRETPCLGLPISIGVCSIWKLTSLCDGKWKVRSFIPVVSSKRSRQMDGQLGPWLVLSSAGLTEIPLGKEPLAATSLGKEKTFSWNLTSRKMLASSKKGACDASHGIARVWSRSVQDLWKRRPPTVGGAKVIFVRTHTAQTYTYTSHKQFADHYSAAHTLSARARRNKMDKVRDTFSGRACPCAHPELHQSPLHCCPRAHSKTCA